MLSVLWTYDNFISIRILREDLLLFNCHAACHNLSHTSDQDYLLLLLLLLSLPESRILSVNSKRIKAVILSVYCGLSGCDIGVLHL